MPTIGFTDVTYLLGSVASYRGPTWGVNWGQVTRGLRPDLFFSGHFLDLSTVLLNDNGGAFAELDLGLTGDRHTLSFADFDNDGDQDALILRGGGNNGINPITPENNGNSLLINDGQGGFVDEGSSRGLLYPDSRGRSPFWFDADRDGDLDVYLSADDRSDGMAPSTLFIQNADGTFHEDLSGIVEPDAASRGEMRMSDINGDGMPDLIASTRWGIGTKFLLNDGSGYNIGTTGGYALNPTQIQNFAIADFNNDLLPDFWGVRDGTKAFTRQIGPTEFIAMLALGTTREAEIRFTSDGQVSFDMADVFRLYADEIYIGASGFHPTDIAFVLDPADTAVHGEPAAFADPAQKQVRVWYDTGTGEWVIHEISTGKPQRMRITSTADITGITLDAPPGFTEPDDDLLLFNTGSGFTDVSVSSGIAALSLAHQDIAVGDFDNDMDIDAYVLSSYKMGNLPDSYYENNGDGTFTYHSVPSLGGPTPGGTGIGVSIGDYDGDGFLDVITSNGFGSDRVSPDGQFQLLRNTGNGNNWLMIDLEGVVMNRDGIGSTVYVTAGGITQMREQTNGMHGFMQDHARLHFGLAQNTVVDEIRVRWTDGFEQVIDTPVAVNQVIRIVEDRDFGPGFGMAAQGKAGVYVGQTDLAGLQSVRILGGGGATYRVEIISSADFTDVSVTGDATATSSVTARRIVYETSDANGDDGFDFRVDPAAETLVLVTRDGVANPRDVFFGPVGQHHTQDGWIVEADAVGAYGAPARGALGLFMGRTPGGDIRFTAAADTELHRFDLTMFSDDTVSFAPVNLEASDGFAVSGGVLSANLSTWRTWNDSIDLTPAIGSSIGIVYRQDGIWQGQAGWDHDLNGFGDPNAYRLPVIDTAGPPVTDKTTDQGLFVWEDPDQQGDWIFRFSGGDAAGRQDIAGTITSTAAFGVQDEGNTLESNDILSFTAPGNLTLSLSYWGGFTDTFRVTALPGQRLSVDLDVLAGSPLDIFIGADRVPLGLTEFNLG